MTITIRSAGRGDEAAVAGLVRQMAAEEEDASPIDEAYVRRFLATPGCGVLLAWDGEAAAGVLSFCLTPGLYHAADSGLIELLFVDASRRGEGIGRRLVEAALRLFEQAGCAEAGVSTGAANDAAQHVYRAAGLTDSSLLLEMHFGG